MKCQDNHAKTIAKLQYESAKKPNDYRGFSQNSAKKNFSKIDEKYMDLAFKMAKQSGCIRADHMVGAVAVKNNLVIATGVNDTPSRIMPCRERGFCIREKMGIKSGTHLEIEYCIHAEQQLICNALRDGVRLDGCDIYVTMKPCPICTRLLIENNVSRIFFHRDYDNDFTDELCKISGVELIKI
jgi:dCMP deaminase